MIKPDVFDPKLNRAYAEIAEHYGSLIDPARALKPKDKPRVERPMPYIRDSFWRGRTWESVAEMQTAAAEWSMTIAGRRPHRGLDGAQPVVMFNAVSLPAMKPLAHHRFEIAAWSRPKVASDCHVSVARVLYSVPWRYVGRRLDVRLSERRVEVFDAILRLADKHSPERLNAACRRALQVGDPTYRTIKGILAAGTEHDGQPQPDTTSTAPAHLHGPDRLFNPDLPIQPSDGELGEGEVA